ncbi:Xylulose kinase [Halomonas citrativorans]|uniref:Xylulose kinase n=1 Tax=Halomonas citrativorans TaxID=2742612 RepID=A0A1R4HNB0_9GAMM|nr:Xylulose kinase [Halomonas citrativorans]
MTDACIEPRAIRAIGVSGQQHGLVALDAAGEPVHPAKLWCDTETANHNTALVDRLGGETGCLDKPGLVLQTGYTASKLAWLRDSRPDAYRRIDSLLLPHDYLNFWLTGERVSEVGDASGTGYFDSRTRRWREDILAEIAPTRVLPRLIESHKQAGVVRYALAREPGLAEGVVVSSGGDDNMLGTIGTGNIAHGLVTLSLGTSGTVRAYSEAPVIANNAMVANFCASSGGWLPLICTMNMTSATTRVRKLLGLDLSTFNERLANALIGAEGVTVLPFFNGERAPALPQATANFFGADQHQLHASQFVSGSRRERHFRSALRPRAAWRPSRGCEPNTSDRRRCQEPCMAPDGGRYHWHLGDLPYGHRCRSARCSTAGCLVRALPQHLARRPLCATGASRREIPNQPQTRPRRCL